MSPSGWAGLAEAVERTASEMDPQAVAITYDGLGKMEAAAAAVSTSGWAGPAEAVGRNASEMNEREVSISLYALGVLPAAAVLSPSTRKHLEAAAEREAPNMTSQGRKMTLQGCERLKLRNPSSFL